MQKYYSMSTSKMKIRTIEDYIAKTYANAKHMLCPMFKNYFIEDKAALFRGGWEYRAKLKPRAKLTSLRVK